MNRQIRLVGIGIIVLFVALFAQLNYLQVFHASALDNNPQNTRRIIQEYDRPRGDIVSADGKLLAYSKPVNAAFKYQRVYPQSSLFGQITGFFSYTYGSDGVEKTYDSFLAGAKSSFRLPTSLRQLESELANTNKAENVTLTLSANMQAAAAQALGSRAGAVVALNPQTGAILAMYANPTFDPNVLSGLNQPQVQASFQALVHAPGNPMSSSAYRNRFPPGSTFKILTAAAVYDHNPALADKNYPVSSGLPLPQTNGQVLHNFAGETCGGMLPADFTVSCDSAFGAIGLDLGAQALSSEAQSFGFDHTPPLDLPTVAKSYFPPASSFAHDLPGLAKSAIGQENVAASPLEMALVAGAIADGGTIMVPHVLDHLTNSQNQVVSTYQPKVWLDATSASTAAQMTNLMQSVVYAPNGTGQAAQIPGVRVAGKTGTAQTGQGTIDAWFASFAPVSNPRVAVGVLVENQPPGDQYQGGTIAAPIARAVMQAALAAPPPRRTPPPPPPHTPPPPGPPPPPRPDHHRPRPDHHRPLGFDEMTQQQQLFSGRYELVRHVARGGMAQVYLARDLLLDRPVALKVLFPELSVDESFVERFRREAQAAANLSHPNIVSIYDWGQGDHTYFIVMEYIDGYTLSSLIRQGPPGPPGAAGQTVPDPAVPAPPGSRPAGPTVPRGGPLSAERAAAIGADVASALEFAHRRQVIHRDVKPGNVLIDRSGQVKVTDFGIARAVGAKEGLTQTGAVMGTATYFSPEQAQGYTVDARSDVYSLGVVLFEMVVGRPPFEGDSPVAIAYKHVREEPPLPSVLNPTVPKAFEAIVLKAMAKDPDDRYQTADALRADLMRFHQGRGVLAPEVDPTMMAATGVLAPAAAQVETTTAVRPDGALLEDERRSRNALFAGLLLLLLALLGVLIFFLGRELGWWGSAKTLTVPGDLIGKPYQAARSELAADGFTNVGERTVNSASPVDQVVGSTPPPRSKMKANGRLVLAVSQGPAQVGVPSEINKPQAAAVADLKANGFNPTVTNAPSPTVQLGRVINQSPSPGQTAPKGSTVTLTVSTGPATVTIPSVRGDDPVTAANALRNANLNPQEKTQYSADVPATEVIGTNPAAGTKVPPGSTVVVFVSRGAQQVTVPDVNGKPVSQAEAMLTNAGLSYTTTAQPVTDQAQDNVVQSSSPAQGSAVNQGSTVNLVVGQYTAPTTTSAPTTTTPTTAPGPPTTPAAGALGSVPGHQSSG